jgi:hypothetical protein
MTRSQIVVRTPLSFQVSARAALIDDHVIDPGQFDTRGAGPNTVDEIHIEIRVKNRGSLRTLKLQ